MKKFFKECAMPCKALVIITIAFAFALLQGCVSDKVLASAATCSANQTAVRVAELNALAGKMDSKDVVIHMLAGKLAGDPCASIVIAEVNGKNKIINGLTLGAVAVAPQYFNYKQNQDMFSAFGQFANTDPTNISISAETGSTSEGGGTGDININTSSGASQLNTGTRTTNDFDKGILGGEGSINDADQVTTDGLF